MTGRWYTPAQIVAAAGGDLPTSIGSLNKLIAARGWRSDADRARKVAKRGGGYEYHESLLPEGVRARLHLAEMPKAVEAEDATWIAFERLPAKKKAEAERRLAAIQRYGTLVRGGATSSTASLAVCREFGCAARTLTRWREAVAGLSRSKQLAALAPQHTGTPSRRSACHRKAYEAFKSDYLRPEQPTFSACYRRMATVARREGWAPIPSERALRRHLDSDVPPAVQTLAREGRDQAKALFPAQTRARQHFHAMQAVTMDGHRFDVFVRTSDGTVLRPHLIALQDLHSGKLIAWRLATSENKDVVRLVIGDMITVHGIPEMIYLDNGRAFASKDISGGTANRFRFTSKPDDPDGLLTTLGVTIHWTTPYSGQSKPIERAFRDLTDTISRHPFCAGAYTGNRPDAKPENYGSKAIEFEAFRAHVASQIAEHNGRAGRKAAACRGRSFDETFRDSLARPDTVVRWASESQRSLWLMAATRIKARSGNGEIHFMGNRYWHPVLTGHAGSQVTVRYDPDDLKAGVKVYDQANRLITDADCIVPTGFDDTDAARRHSRNRAGFIKALKTQKLMHTTLTADELAALYADRTVRAADEGEASRVPSIPRIVPRGGAAVRLEEFEDTPEPGWDEEAENAFSKGLRLVTGGRQP